MAWPDIFWKRRPKPELPPPFKLAPENAKTPEPAPAPEPQPPTIKPVPATLSPQITKPSVMLKGDVGASPTATSPTSPTSATTPTIPATHGVVLRPPVSATASTKMAQTPPQKVGSIDPARQGPMKNIEQLMAEADPVQTLRQTGNVRVLRPLTAEPNEAPKNPVPKPVVAKVETMTPEPVAVAPKPAVIIPPPAAPSFSTPVISVPAVESKKIETKPLPVPDDNDSPFILKPSTIALPKVIPVIPPIAPSAIPFGSIFRRKARMTDVARIVLPPKREESEPSPVSNEPSPTVVPPAFPVVAMTARAGSPPVVAPEMPAAPAIKTVESVAPEKIVPVEKVAEPELNLPITAKESTVEPDKKIESPAAESLENKSVPEVKVEPPPIDKAQEPLPLVEKLVEELKKEPLQEPVPVVETKPVSVSETPAPDAPKIDPEAHKPEQADALAPKLDPEAHKDAPKPPEQVPVTTLSTPSTPPEKREFHLANGERVAGTVLSETPEAVYVEHGTLGVITIPRANIAKRLVEIILINGDRIVGDIMAETADTLYVRHASLGMLTVPRAQRSTRVVEAILKDGDRILGEVLTETDAFTVIRSATLGTVTIPHGKLAMLNRKIEQVEMKSLPLPAPELQDKPPA